MPVSGARTTAGEECGQADYGVGGRRRAVRKPLPVQPTEDEADLRAEDEHRREQAAGRAGRIGKRTEREPECKDQADGGQGSGVEQRLLRERVSASDPLGRQPTQEADADADQRRPSRYRNPVSLIGHRQCAHDGARVGGSRERCNDTEGHMDRHRREAREGLRRHGEIRLHAHEHARHSDRARRGAQCRGCGARVETPQQFLQHEHSAGDRGVEGRGEPRARARGEQHAGVDLTAPEQPADQVRDRVTHLHTGPFATEGEAGADGEHSADELDDGGAHGSARFAAVDRRLDLRDAATCRIRGNPAHQRCGKRNRRSGAGDDEQKADEPLLMRPGNVLASQRIGRLKQAPEYGADEPRGTSHEQRQQRENQRAGSAVVLIEVWRHIVVTRGDCLQ